jgi:hypothetical protein
MRHAVAALTPAQQTEIAELLRTLGMGAAERLEALAKSPRERSVGAARRCVIC